LVTALANDENELEDQCFKLYYLFSHPGDDLFLIIETLLERGSSEYASIYSIYPAIAPFEQEITDFFGLYPKEHSERASRHQYLHECYPTDFYPLRRDKTLEDIHKSLEGYRSPPVNSQGDEQPPPEGEVYLPIGPIHAGVIEPGHFLFRIGSEVIEGVSIRLGYTHKGIERLFQTNYTLQDGWRLAEQVSGDSSFAHSMAYCQAVEVLAGTAISTEATLLRGLFLELERMANHIGDGAALAHDMALDVVASELAVLREEVMMMNGRLAGNRFLRGLNRPGGVLLPNPLNTLDIQSVVSRVSTHVLEMSCLLIERNDFRERTINIGVLPSSTAEKIGVTGLIARASGVERDFRVQHPFGPFASEQVSTLIQDHAQDSRLLPVMHRPMTGDVFSRFLMRIQEISLSSQLIEKFLEACSPSQACDFRRPINLSKIPNFEFGLGYVEGWRGDIVYWVMKDKFERIYRCKVRDPSTLNWPGLKSAVEPQKVNEEWVETMLADFPIINKSFNLSYSGNDL
jgi:Ni,Fe-hydrogenase III large subunit